MTKGLHGYSISVVWPESQVWRSITSPVYPFTASEIRGSLRDCLLAHSSLGVSWSVDCAALFCILPWVLPSGLPTTPGDSVLMALLFIPLPLLPGRLKSGCDPTMSKEVSDSPWGIGDLEIVPGMDCVRENQAGHSKPGTDQPGQQGVGELGSIS